MLYFCKGKSRGDVLRKRNPKYNLLKENDIYIKEYLDIGYNLKKNIEKYINIIINEKSREIGIIKIFEFSSELQRMSVLVKNINKKENQREEEDYIIYVKGSPEKIIELSIEDSIPEISKKFYTIILIKDLD
jgi:cation-transporting ATPase 13A3/4/5